MRYEIIIPNPFGEGKVMIRMPLDIAGVSRPSGERFISVNGMSAVFDEHGNHYEPTPYNPMDM